MLRPGRDVLTIGMLLVIIAYNSARGTAMNFDAVEQAISHGRSRRNTRRYAVPLVVPANPQQ